MNDMIVFCVVLCDLNILKGKVVDHTIEDCYDTYIPELFYIWWYNLIQ